MPDPGGGGARGHPQDFDIKSATNPTYIFHTMLENIQERMRALIAQRDNVLVALTTLWQQSKA